ncbi:ABC transporter [Ruaniaceae bacterium KH17]|nr:ABC transporter [Ruaniaceae bacterium KH17]
MLQVSDVTVLYPAGPGEWNTAVDGVSLEIATGEIVALLGPSGCGKSSLLRAVAGLEPLSSGDVLWDGESVAREPVHKRGFGLMFQDGQLFVHQDVAGNVGYGLFRQPRAERERRVAEMLTLVGLAGYGERRVDTLSGGERQRVALARSLAPAPRMMMLDEPLSSLDRALREHLVVEMRQILRDADATALYVTHDQGEARAIADRIGVMMAGKLVQIGTPDELWANPATTEVEAFLAPAPSD